MSYILKTDENARKRLDVQHKLYEESSLKLLNKAGSLLDKKGLEIGCGSGVMTRHLASFVGTTGEILSIDINQQQIEAAKQIIKEEGITNVRFQQIDINQLAELDEQFDFIYCRMVLCHLNDANYAIEQMIQCLKPGGALICQEPVIHDGSFCYPQSDAFNEFTQSANTLHQISGCDYEIAYRMEQVIASNGLTIEFTELCHPLLNSTEKRMICVLTQQEIAPALIQAGLATEEIINKRYQELLALAKSNCTMTWIRMHSVLARKSA